MRWERVRQVGLGDSSSGPGKRWGHTCNAIKGGRFLYVFGGFGRDHCLTNQVHVFDVETQIWTQPVINGAPPCPRDSHSCTTVGDNLFVFGGTDGTNYLNDLHILDTSSHTWMRPDIRGEGPGAREAHSAVLVDKRLFIFGGCGKSSDSDDYVFYNDLYILNTEAYVWKCAITTGKPPCARDNHTCSTWKNKIVVVGGEDLDDYYLSDVHILETDKFVWKELKTSGQLLTPRAGHVTVVLESNLFVFGGFTDSQKLYNDLYVLDLDTAVWSKVVAMEEGPSARFSSAAVCLDPYKAGSFFFVGGCNKNLEPLDDIYYLYTEGGYDVRFDQNPGRLSRKKQMRLKCQWQKLAVARTSIDQGGENLPLNIGSTDQRKTMFQAMVTENIPLGYTIETIIDGKVLHGVLFSNRLSSVQMADPSFSNRKRPATSDGYCHRRAKTPLSKDSAGSSRQGDPVDPANKKVADSNDMDTPMTDTVDASVNKNQRPLMSQEAEAAAVTSDVKDQDAAVISDAGPQEAEAAAVTSDVKDQDAAVISDAGPQEAEAAAVTSDVKDQDAAVTSDAGPQEAEAAAVTSDVKDQDASQPDTGIVNTEQLPVTHEQANVEPVRNEITRDAAKADTGGDASSQNEGEVTVAAEDANAEQQPQPQQS